MTFVVVWEPEWLWPSPTGQILSEIFFTPVVYVQNDQRIAGIIFSLRPESRLGNVIGPSGPQAVGPASSGNSRRSGSPLSAICWATLSLAAGTLFSALAQAPFSQGPTQRSRQGSKFFSVFFTHFRILHKIVRILSIDT